MSEPNEPHKPGFVVIFEDVIEKRELPSFKDKSLADDLSRTIDAYERVVVDVFCIT